MKYLCLVYFEEKIWDGMSSADSDALTREAGDYDRDLQKNGYLIAAEALQSIHTATTVRVRNGRVSATDGPFAETREVLGGFILINARDLDDAIQVASKIPLARLGSVEVRPVLQIEERAGK